MLLRRLIEYADRKALSDDPINYSERPVNWILQLSSNGELNGLVQVKEKIKRNVPFLKLANASKAFLLYGKPEYVFGFDFSGKERAQTRHQLFLELVNNAATTTKHPDLESIARWYASDALDTMPEGMKESDCILITVDGRYPTDDPIVQKFWGDETTSSETEADDSPFRCMACGQKCVPLERHMTPIDSGGLAMISANERVFESYGLQKSTIAPMCETCERKYAKALDHIIKNHSHRFLGTTYLCWTDDDSDFNLFAEIDKPDEESVRRLLTSVYGSNPSKAEIEVNKLHLASYTQNKTRMMLRQFDETTVSAIQSTIANWFKQQVFTNGNEKYYGLYPLALSLYPSKSKKKEVSGQVATSLFEKAVLNRPLPPSILSLLTQRFAAEEEKFTGPRMALLKLYLLQNRTWEDDLMSLNQTRNNPAYVCGRLLSQLDKIQNFAIPGVKAGVVDKYYGSASTSPASVFSLLIQGGNQHLSKIKKTKPGLAVTFEKELSETLDLIDEFPVQFTPEEQGMFALGFYHQKAFRKAKNGEENNQ